MDQDAKLEVYQAQVENLRGLASALKHVRGTLNSALRTGDYASTESFNRMYALLYCSWVEANFSKTIHTPYGFDLDEIEQVKIAQKTSVGEGWKKCVALGIRHLDARRGNFSPNVAQKLSRLIETYVVDPSVIRNKLAHGQWRIALNRENSSVNHDLTRDISLINVVEIEKRIYCQKKLTDLVESLIETPDKMFIRDWYNTVSQIEAELLERSKYTLDGHVAILRKKPKRWNCKEIPRQ